MASIDKPASQMTLAELHENQPSWDIESMKRGLTRLTEIAENGPCLYDVYTPDECLEQPAKKDVRIWFMPAKGSAKPDTPWIVSCSGGAYIEKNMTKGNLSVKKDMLPVIQYQPEGSDKEIPLYVASSIVSEISPLLLVLKSGINFKAMIIEEPEAHLHPELQQKMARLIINMMNLGIPVWITTHSDTILQHINNMMKLKNHVRSNELQQEYGYKKEDLLFREDIQMYQFVTENSGKTRLIPLEATKYGFVVPTFNNALEKIVEEVYAFQED